VGGSKVWRANPITRGVTDEAQEVTQDIIGVLQRLEARLAKQRAKRSSLGMPEVTSVAEGVGDVVEDSDRFEPHHR
jgi:hypothetical protein